MSTCLLWTQFIWRMLCWQVSRLSCLDLCCFHALEGGVVTVSPKLHCHSEIRNVGRDFSFSFVIPRRKATSSVWVLCFNTSYLSPFYSQAFPPHTDWQISARLWGPKEFWCTVFLPVLALLLQALRLFPPQTTASCLMLSVPQFL